MSSIYASPLHAFGKNKRAQKDQTRKLAPEGPSISSMNIDSPFFTDFLSLFYLIRAEPALLPCVAKKLP